MTDKLLNPSELISLASELANLWLKGGYESEVRTRILERPRPHALAAQVATNLSYTDHDDAERFCSYLRE